jgi:NADP-dependent 3-hydroxy acid dehydrogenase YdfG
MSANNTKKVILITGASRGIGKACAVSLANKDSILILMARDLKSLKIVEKECKDLGAEVKCVALDLADTKKIKDEVSKVINEYGRIDTLINNAGIWDEQPFESGDMDKWDHALDVNLKSAIHLARYCLEGMSSEGAVIFIGSSASKKTYAGGTNYCAAKFGLLGFANSLFEDIREKGIKVSSILLGLVNTSMHENDKKLDPDKMIQPEDVALTVKFILSMPHNVCPLEITLFPQQNPRKYY